MDLPEINQEQKKLNQSYKYQLELIYELAQKIGFKAIYILIDKVDETHLTTNRADLTFKLIEPLIKDLETHSIKGYAFKYFLWDKVYEDLLKGGRPDRITINSLVWSRDRLVLMLKNRLLAYSNKRISNMEMLFENINRVSADDMITVLAWRSPRNVVRICEEIINEQTLISANVNKLDNRVIDRASLKISERISEEHYGVELLGEIKKLDRELFSINHLGTNIYKVSNNAVRPRVTNWIDKGFTYLIGVDKSGDSKKPTNVYFLGDPRVNRIVNSKYTISDWFNNSWFPCIHCDADILLDFKYINEELDLECWNCKRAIG